MSFPKFFEFKEHSEQLNKDELNLSEILDYEFVKNNFNSENLNYLGLNDKFESNYFIGMRWVEWSVNEKREKGIIWVKPKAEYIPYEQLLWKCLNHPIVCNHLDQCYAIFPNEPAIPLLDDAKDFITPLLITDFLVRVQKIVKKGLKKGFVNVQETLNNKIKGKILVNQSIKQQLKKNTITHTHCSYQVHTIDCIENRILKAALLQSQKYIYRFLKDRNNIIDVLHYNLIAFDDVNAMSISNSDFNTINHSAFYKEYKPALDLAKLILKSFGFSINSDISTKDKTVPPFYINMPELFERYCEVLLRNIYPDTLAGYQYQTKSETCGGRFKLRPDFIIPSEDFIVDSKYKYWIEFDEGKEDIAQLSLYSRHLNTIQKLKNPFPKLIFLYPSVQKTKFMDFDNRNSVVTGFKEIYKFAVDVYMS